MKMDRIEMLVDLVNPASAVRLAAARRILKISAEELDSLSQIEKGRLLLALEACLIGNNDEVREAAAEIVGRIGTCVRPLITHLIGALEDDPNILVRANAAEALSLTPSDEFDRLRIRAALSKAMRDDDNVLVGARARHSLRLIPA
jgi:hypothetical protein